jgi:hypothetical protein
VSFFSVAGEDSYVQYTYLRRAGNMNQSGSTCFTGLGAIVGLVFESRQMLNRDFEST